MSVPALVIEHGSAPERPPRPAVRLLVRNGNRITIVPVAEVDWIAAADYYAQLHAAGRRHLVRESLASLAERLDPEQFVRVHRSAIVNIERVREIQPYFNARHILILRCGTRIPVSRRGRTALEELLGQRI